MEKHVTSLDLSKRLKAIGVAQDSNYRWIRTENVWFIDPMFATPESLINHGEWYSAYLASELGELLPQMCEIRNLRKENGGIDWNVNYYFPNNPNIIAHTLPDALGEMLAYLLENGSIKLEGNNAGN